MGLEGHADRANELNLFFNRFDTAAPLPLDSAAGCPTTTAALPPPTPPPYRPLVCPPTTSIYTHLLHPSPLLCITVCPPQPEDLTSPPSVTSTVFSTPDLVRRQLTRLYSGKAAGPEGFPPRVLKACASQLCGVLSQIFNLSLHPQRVPVVWKTSCLVPVPKTPCPTGPQDYRPVALTSHIMKTLERLVLEQLRPMIRPFTDPLHFAYQPRLGVEDGIIYLLNRVYTHLDKPTCTVGVMFFDFSSAFNIIRPALLGEKMAAMQVLLSPFLFTLYTSDFNYCNFCIESCHLQKFSDD